MKTFNAPDKTHDLRPKLTKEIQPIKHNTCFVTQIEVHYQKSRNGESRTCHGDLFNLPPAGLAAPGAAPVAWPK